MSAQVLELRQLLEQRFPDAVPAPYRTAGAVATGVDALDALLPAGGVPRGRLTAWTPGGGATALLRAACEAVVGRGERAAWVDGAGVTVGESWPSGPLLVRPKDRRQALRCAEELVRSGGFALVVLAGVEPERGGRVRAAGLGDAENVRLGRSAREGGAALVTLADRVPTAALRLASRIDPGGYRWRRGPRGEPAEVEAVTVRVRVRGMGWNRETEVELPVVHHDVRLSLDPGLADRRGARS